MRFGSCVVRHVPLSLLFYFYLSSKIHNIFCRQGEKNIINRAIGIGMMRSLPRHIESSLVVANEAMIHSYCPPYFIQKANMSKTAPPPRSQPFPPRPQHAAHYPSNLFLPLGSLSRRRASRVLDSRRGTHRPGWGAPTEAGLQSCETRGRRVCPNPKNPRCVRWLDPRSWLHEAGVAPGSRNASMGATA